MSNDDKKTCLLNNLICVCFNAQVKLHLTSTNPTNTITIAMENDCFRTSSPGVIYS